MKIIDRSDDDSDEKEILNEINILKKLSHPNIVKIFEFYITRGHYYLVTEFCKDGEFFNYIKQKFTENQLAVLFELSNEKENGNNNELDINISTTEKKSKKGN